VRDDDGSLRFPRVAAAVAAMYFALLGVLVAMGRLPPIVLAVTAGASVVAYALYRADKRRAQRGSRRVPESTLQVIGLLGGWPGALVAQWRLRHKNRKLSFQIVFWLTVALNVAATFGLARLLNHEVK
jgi:uncharacterized membrane protein YsdA (DUF1294 family)